MFYTRKLNKNVSYRKQVARVSEIVSQNYLARAGGVVDRVTISV